MRPSLSLLKSHERITDLLKNATRILVFLSILKALRIETLKSKIKEQNKRAKEKSK